MGIAGSVTSAVSGTSVTLPASNMTIIGASVYAHTISGYLSIPIDGSRNALFAFTAPIDVTTLKVPAGQVMPMNGIRTFHFTTSGAVLNYTGTGLTSGTFVFYYGTPFPNSRPSMDYAGVAASFTTESTDTFTFPGGPVKLTGIILIQGSNTAQTNLQVRIDWNSGTGKSVFVTFGGTTLSEIIPLNNIEAASTLTVTYTYAGTHVGTGYLIVYYQL